MARSTPACGTDEDNPTANKRGLGCVIDEVKLRVSKKTDSRYLFFRGMVPHLIRRRRRAVEFLNDVKFAAREGNGCLDAVVAFRTGRLHATTALRAVRTHVLNVDRGRDDLYVREGELRALSDDAPVERYHRAAIVIQPVTVASLLVRVEVHTAELYRKKTGCLLETEEGISSQTLP